MAKANFDNWVTRQFWTVGDGAMLLLDLEPTGEYPPAFDMRDPNLQRQYHDMVDAARSDLGRKLPTKWESFSPVLPATRANAAFVNVLPGDWLRWAEKKKFRIPPQLKAAARHLKRTPGLQQGRQEQLEDFLHQLEISAASIGRDFDRGQMPGTKNQLTRLMKDHCPTLRTLSDTRGSTLDNYITRAGCKFRRGRNQPPTDLWKVLGLGKN